MQIQNSIAQVFGQVGKPPGVSAYGSVFATSGSGLTKFITNILRFLIVGAGIFALFNLVMAGYGFMSAGGDAKKVADATAKIWQTLMGLAIAVGSFVLAAIFGKLLFGDYNALLQLRVFGP